MHEHARDETGHLVKLLPFEKLGEKVLPIEIDREPVEREEVEQSVHMLDDQGTSGFEHPVRFCGNSCG